MEFSGSNYPKREVNRAADSISTVLDLRPALVTRARKGPHSYCETQ